MIPRTARTLYFTGALAAGTVLSGCATEPVTRPASGPRAQITINDLQTGGDVVGQALAADLETLVRHDFGGERVVLFLGDIENKTRTVPTGDFEVIARQIRNQMFQNPYFRENVQLREGGRRTAALSRRERTAGGDQSTLGGSDGFRGLNVDADYVFFMNGNAYKLDRQNETGFYIEFSLDRESNSEIVFTKDYFVQYGR